MIFWPHHCERPGACCVLRGCTDFFSKAGSRGAKPPYNPPPTSGSGGWCAHFAHRGTLYYRLLPCFCREGGQGGPLPLRQGFVFIPGLEAKGRSTGGLKAEGRPTFDGDTFVSGSPRRTGGRRRQAMGPGQPRQGTTHPCAG